MGKWPSYSHSFLLSLPLARCSCYLRPSHETTSFSIYLLGPAEMWHFSHIESPNCRYTTSTHTCRNYEKWAMAIPHARAEDLSFSGRQVPHVCLRQVANCRFRPAPSSDAVNLRIGLRISWQPPKAEKQHSAGSSQVINDVMIDHLPSNQSDQIITIALHIPSQSVQSEGL